MKVSEIKDLTAPVVVDYRGLNFELAVFTERFNDPEVRARAKASAPELSPAPVEPDKGQDNYAAALDAYAADLAAHREESRERRKRQDAAFIAEIIKSWTVNGETIDDDDGNPLSVTADALLSLGDVLPAVLFQAIQTEIIRPLKPVNSQLT